MSDFDEIQSLLQERADCNTRINLIPCEGEDINVISKQENFKMILPIFLPYHQNNSYTHPLNYFHQRHEPNVPAYHLPPVLPPS